MTPEERKEKSIQELLEANQAKAKESKVWEWEDNKGNHPLEENEEQLLLRALEEEVEEEEAVTLEGGVKKRKVFSI